VPFSVTKEFFRSLLKEAGKSVPRERNADAQGEDLAFANGA